MHAQTILIDTPEKRDRAVVWLAKIPINEVMQLTLAPYQQTRSQVANRRYWAIIGKISEHTGHDKDELHEALKAKFLGTKRCELLELPYEVCRSTARLNTKEFMHYMEQVESWMISTLGIWLE